MLEPQCWKYLDRERNEHAQKKPKTYAYPKNMHRIYRKSNMTLRVEYEGIILAKVKVADVVTASKDDPIVQSITKRALGRIDTRVLNWAEPIYISITWKDSEETAQYRVSDFINIDTGEPK